MRYQIAYVQSAEDDLGWYRANEQKLIFDAVMRFLHTDAGVESKKRKQLRPNPVAPWELRLGKYRVFYEISESGVVRVLAVGHKEHNELFIRGERVQL